jgi:hypothetical protein
VEKSKWMLLLLNVIKSAMRHIDSETTNRTRASPSTTTSSAQRRLRLLAATILSLSRTRDIPQKSTITHPRSLPHLSARPSTSRHDEIERGSPNSVAVPAGYATLAIPAPALIASAADLRPPPTALLREAPRIASGE